MGANKIGKYEILRELGRGAMGIVYEGWDPDIGRKVAIKTIRFDVISQRAEQDEAQKRFTREARSAGNLNHPNIVTIYDVGQDEGLTYIAMEYIEGESLETMIAEGRRPELEAVLSLIGQIGDALDFAHRHGIIHRDIKPGNILIDKDGRPRLLDFGIARVSSSTMTQTNMVMGTPYYMAPEQIAGKTVDHRADIFSLGTILYEILTLTKPFPGENITTVIYRILNEEPPEPRVYDQNLPAGLDYVVKKALAKNPAQRYQSCRELADDLRNSAAFEGMAFEGGAVPEGSEAALPQAEPKPRKTLLLIVGAMMAVVAIAAAVFLLTGKGSKSPDYAGGGVSPKTEAATPAVSADAKKPETQESGKGGQKPGLEKTDLSAQIADRETPPAKPTENAKQKGTKTPDKKEEEPVPKADTKTEPVKIEVSPKTAAEIEDRLQLVQTAFQKEAYDKCIKEARKILALDPAHAEARTYLDMATLKYAPIQLQSLMNVYRESVKRGALIDFFGLNGTPEFYNEIKAATQALVTDYEDFQVSVSGVSSQIIDRGDGSYRAELNFSEILTAVSRQKKTRVMLSEGKIKWDLVSRDEVWRIRKITRSSSSK